MLKRPFDKSKLPSRHVTEGPERAPHRSYYYAMGMTEEEIHQPLVGVATCWNEAAPCNIALSRQAQAVKMGVKQGYGTPREFTTITVTDGIAMGHEGMRSSLASREAIADTVELTMRGHCYDALVGLAGCDKSLPGMMMAMVRLNVPSVFIYGGSILPGKAPQIDEIPEEFRTRGLEPERHHVRQGARCAGARGLSLCRGLWRAVHRQYHGLCLRGDRSCADEFVGHARALREPRPICRGLGARGDGFAGEKHPRPRRGDAQELAERRPRGGLHRWQHQCRAASARDCA